MKTRVIIPALSAFLLMACNKPEVIPPPTPDGDALNNFFSNNLDSRMQTFSANASTGATIIGSGGIKITIYPNTLTDANGNLISGNVLVELIEIYDRSTMLLTNKPTIGVLPGGDHAMLVSGGEYYLKISQNGTAVQSNGGVVVNVPTDNTGGIDNAMALFRGGELIDNNDLVWTEDVDDSVNVVDDSTGGTFYNSYEILEGEWGWTNVDRFWSDPNPKTTLLVDMPDGFDHTNCEVFIAYEGEPNALARLDVVTEAGYFSEHYGQIPIGMNIHVIAVTVIDDNLHYAIKSETIVDGNIISISSLTETTQSELTSLINDLP